MSVEQFRFGPFLAHREDLVGNQALLSRLYGSMSFLVTYVADVGTDRTVSDLEFIGHRIRETDRSLPTRAILQCVRVLVMLGDYIGWDYFDDLDVPYGECSTGFTYLNACDLMHGFCHFMGLYERYDMNVETFTAFKAFLGRLADMLTGEVSSGEFHYLYCESVSCE